MAEAVLYSFWRSSCSWRARIALELKGIKYQIKPIDILKTNAHQSEEYTRINPLRKVPALHVDGYTIVESYNIIQYLEETRPQKPLLPKDGEERCRVREICEMIQSGIQPLQNVGVRHAIPGDNARKDEWARMWIDNGFRAIEKIMSKTAGDYSVGNDITMADCFVVPQVFNARSYKVDMSQYPTIERVESALKKLKPFLVTHPLNQPDAPPDVRHPSA